jgi:DNA-binding transcriptional MerR regulator
MDRPAEDVTRGVYGISVAAELVGMGVQNLRLYEARGLVEPGRTDGGTRRYSANDLDRLRRIGELLDAGLNLAGIAKVLELEGENAQLRAGMADSGGFPTAPIARRSAEGAGRRSSSEASDPYRRGGDQPDARRRAGRLERTGRVGRDATGSSG